MPLLYEYSWCKTLPYQNSWCNTLPYQNYFIISKVIMVAARSLPVSGDSFWFPGDVSHSHSHSLSLNLLSI